MLIEKFSTEQESLARPVACSLSHLVLVWQSEDAASDPHVPELGCAIIRAADDEGRAPGGRAAAVDEGGVFRHLLDLTGEV